MALERSSGERAHSIFVRVAEKLDDDQARFLAERGVRPVVGAQVLTGNSTRTEIEALACEAWVLSISGATRTRPLSKGR